MHPLSHLVVRKGELENLETFRFSAESKQIPEFLPETEILFSD